MAITRSRSFPVTNGPLVNVVGLERQTLDEGLAVDREVLCREVASDLH